jgi:alkylation response protein AidB-like acyl-CoA dehydrogenase
LLLVHNAIGTAVISELGDEEQRARLLKDSINMDKVACFGLTEPSNGSDASGLTTSATKTEGGWLLNGKKRWIGNAPFASYITVWAKNTSDGNKVQGFVVTPPSAGLTITKIENKYSLRCVQNADIDMKDVFVPDNNKLTKATDFATGTNVILESSRLGVAWMVAGVGCGAYEAALKYCLKRNQFGRPIAKFQLI